MSNISTKIHVENGDVIWQRTQDCSSIAAETRRLSLEGVHGSSEMRHAARLPMVLVEAYMNDKGITFQEFMGNKSHVKTMLSDPALADFRIWEGKV
jgi:hypothetical protein